MERRAASRPARPSWWASIFWWCRFHWAAECGGASLLSSSGGTGCPGCVLWGRCRVCVVGRSGRRLGRSSGWVWDRVVRALWGVLGGFSMAWRRSGRVWILFFPLESLPRPALADWRWLGFEVSFVVVAAARRQRTPTARSA